MAALPTFTAALPALGKAATLVSGLDTVFSTINLVRDNSASLKAAKLQQEQARQTANAQREQQAFASDQAEIERQKALRRAVSRQKAQFGAQGVSGADGSAEAVLLGLFEESDEEKKQREKLDQMRSRALDARAGNNSRLDLLEQSRLSERNRIDRILFG